jgi:hypothetical protein
MKEHKSLEYEMLGKAKMASIHSDAVMTAVQVTGGDNNGKLGATSFSVTLC